VNIVLATCRAGDNSLLLLSYALGAIRAQGSDGEERNRERERERERESGRERRTLTDGNALCYIRVIRYDNVTCITGRRSR